MNEQDFIRKIEENAKDIPIPESVSPKAIKDLLDNAAQYNEEVSIETARNKGIDSNRRLMKRLTLAACFLLCFTGCIYGANLISVHNDKKQESMLKENTTEATPSMENDEELVQQTNLKTPKSYEEYYNTLKTAYDKYYEQLAHVNTLNGDQEIVIPEMSESKMSNQRNEIFAEESIMEDSVAGTASKGFSSTNTQEETVDEGDIVKTDGSYIYKVMKIYNHDDGYTHSHLTITKADKGKLTAMASIDLNKVLNPSENEHSEFHEFYLDQNKLYLIFTKNSYDFHFVTVNDTYIVVYDLSDKENPQKVNTLSQSGWYESSRISDGYLYTISNFSETSLEDATKLNQYVPSINRNPIPCDRIYYPPNIFMDTTHVVTSLKLNKPDDFTDNKAIPSNGSNYYVSDSSIYFYTTLYEDVTNTEIMKIDYKNGKLSVGNSAIVSGYLYDSFALNENDGYLRVVATIPANSITILRNSGAMTNNKITINQSEPVKENVNVLYILDKNMELTGKISGIAPGETIQSARFMGDIGYFVTFRNMDPLFSVDLSDPKNPEIIGSLKISGFSNYLHFYNKDLMLGLGQEVDPKTQEWIGLKLSMFNISNPSDVTEQDKYIIENSVMSDALYNHKAIMIDPEKNIFGFAYGAETNKNYYSFKNYYATYTYNKEDGFIETAKYLIDDDEYDYDSTRGIYIGDYFYLTTNRSITSYKIGSEQSISTVTYKGA